MRAIQQEAEAGTIPAIKERRKRDERHIAHCMSSLSSFQLPGGLESFRFKHPLLSLPLSLRLRCYLYTSPYASKSVSDYINHAQNIPHVRGGLIAIK